MKSDDQQKLADAQAKISELEKENMAMRDTNSELHEERSALESCLAKKDEALRTIVSVPTYLENYKECRWCGASKAGFHFKECPRTIAHEALALKPEETKS